MHAHAAHSAGRPAVALSGPQAPNAAGAASVETARLLAFGGGSDFLTLLTRSAEPEPRRPEAQRPEAPRARDERDAEKPAAERDVPEAKTPDAVILEGPVRADAATARPNPVPVQQAAAVAPPEPARGEKSAAPLPADTANTSRGLTAAVEAAQLDSRPRAALAAGTSTVALGAQAQSTGQPAAQAQPGAQAGTTDGANAAEAGRFNGAEPGRSPSGERAAMQAGANTTMAGLEQMAQKAAQQTGQAAGQTQGPNAAMAPGQAGGQSGVPGQAGLAQAAQLPSQAAEPAQAAQRMAVQAAAGTKPGAFVPAAGGLDALAPAGAPTPTAKTEVAQAVKPTAQTARTAQPAVDQVAVQIQKGAAAGKDRIQIKLNPAELGRVDVKLEFQSDGGVRAVVAVERAETFDLLQRDARSLERALADAGFRGQASLSFEMHNGGAGGQFAGGDSRGDERAPAGTGASGTASTEPEIEASVPDTRTAAAGGVDIRA